MSSASAAVDAVAPLLSLEQGAFFSREEKEEKMDSLSDTGSEYDGRNGKDVAASNMTSSGSSEPRQTAGESQGLSSKSPGLFS